MIIYSGMHNCILLFCYHIFQHINIHMTKARKEIKKMNLKNVCAVLLTITGVVDGMLLLDIVIAVMLLIFLFSTTCLCLQLYALHVLKIELTEDEMHVYDLMCYDNGKSMLKEDGLAEDFVQDTIGKIEAIVNENVWMKYVQHVY